MTFELFMQNLVNSISIGSLYALVAIGYTMVYGILRLINFAHGDVFMMGAYFAFYLVTLTKIPWYLSFILAIAGAALLGFSIDRIAYKPLRNAPRISALITAMGMSFFLESLAVVLFTGVPKSYREVAPSFFSDVFIIGDPDSMKALRIPIISGFTIIITVICLIGLWYIIYRTKIGMAMRAISTDIPTVSLMGINVDLVIGFTFALGSALAAIGGFLWATRYPQINPYMGFMPGLKAFIAAVFGGIGSIQGAVLGGFVLGLIEVMTIAFFPDLSGFRDAIAFIILIIILMIKPSGLLGKKDIVKV